MHHRAPSPYSEVDFSTLHLPNLLLVTYCTFFGGEALTTDSQHSQLQHTHTCNTTILFFLPKLVWRVEHIKVLTVLLDILVELVAGGGMYERWFVKLSSSGYVEAVSAC